MVADSKYISRAGLTALVLFFGYASCSDFGSGPQSLEDLDLREVVLRFQFAVNGSGSSPSVIFISFAEYDSAGRVRRYFDPDEMFMGRFSSHSPPVKVKSKSRTVPGGGIYDLETNARGILFWVGEVQRISDSEATIPGGYYYGGLNAEGDIFHLRKANGLWWVYRVTVLWVS